METNWLKSWSLRAPHRRLSNRRLDRRSFIHEPHQYLLYPFHLHTSAHHLLHVRRVCQAVLIIGWNSASWSKRMLRIQLQQLIHQRQLEPIVCSPLTTWSKHFWFNGLDDWYTTRGGRDNRYILFHRFPCFSRQHSTLLHGVGWWWWWWSNNMNGTTVSVWERGPWKLSLLSRDSHRTDFNKRLCNAVRIRQNQRAHYDGIIDV